MKKVSTLLLPGCVLMSCLLTACGGATSSTDETDTSDDGMTEESGSTSDTSTSSNCDAQDNFIDVSLRDNYIDWDGDGKTNDDLSTSDLTPSVSVSCDNTTVTVNSNGLINFDFQPIGPDGTVAADNRAPSLQAGDYTYQFPQHPAPAASTTALPLIGSVAVLVTGVRVFGPNEAPFDNYADPYTHGLLDYCGGHTSTYHFHFRPACFFDTPTLGGQSSLFPSETDGVVIGYAFDGYPILAPWACTNTACTETKAVQSSYVYTGSGDYANEDAWKTHEYVEGTGDLDKCNGMTRPDGSYAYYATDTFPYYLACYHGTPTANE